MSGTWPGTANTVLLTTPHDWNFQATGPTIYDTSGNVVWVGPTNQGDPLDMTRINYNGTDAMTFFAGVQAYPTGVYTGKWIVDDLHYQQIGTIAAVNGLSADGHDIQISPDGHYGLVEIYRPKTMDLSHYQPSGGPSDTADTVLEPVLQEINLSNGQLNWEWDAFDHGVSLDESYSPIARNATPPELDFFHTNSIGYSPDGQTIFIGGRHVSAIYAIDKASKNIKWKFGGKDSTNSSSTALHVACGSGCTLPQGQHDAREEAVSQDGKTVTISAYDNGYSFNADLNRGKGVGRTWTLDFTNADAPTAQDATDYGPVADQTTWALNIVGNNRPVGNGARLVSYGNSGRADAWIPNSAQQPDQGQDVWQATFEGQGNKMSFYSYRTLPTPAWNANSDTWPAEAPRLAMDFSTAKPTVYASWNGAIGVTSWQVWAGPDAAHLRQVGTNANTGFETAITAASAASTDAVFVVKAVGGDLQVHGTSVVDPIQTRFAQLGGPGGTLGAPQGAQLAGPNGSWIGQRYANGYIIYNQGAPSAIAVYGPIGQRYVALGGPGSFLGLPLAEQGSSADGVGTYVNFQGGAITYSPSAGAHETHGAIRGEWAATGFEFGVLGYPTSDETGSADGKGRYNNFQGGAITWSPNSGAHETHGPIRGEWAATNYEFGVLGYPTSDVTRSGDGVGSYSNFVNGAISYSPNTGAHETHGPIRTEWGATNFEFGVLGYPTSDVTRSSDGMGYYSNFTGGAVTWDGTSKDTAHETHGPIRAEWASTNFEFGVLGYPTSDTTRSADGVGSYSNFQAGAIVYSPASGAHATYGNIRTKWGSLGFEFGRLGYPVDDPHSVGNGVTQQDFQHGYIQLLPDGTTPVTYY